MMKLGQILCCALLVLSASGMAQVSADLHVPTRSEVGPQAMQQNYPLAKPQDQLTPSGLTGRVRLIIETE